MSLHSHWSCVRFAGVPLEHDTHEAISSLRRFERWLGSWSCPLNAIHTQNELVLQVSYQVHSVAGQQAWNCTKGLS